MPLTKSSSAIEIVPPSRNKSSQKSHHSQTSSYSSNCSTSSNTISRSLSSSSASDEWSYEPASYSNKEKNAHNSNTYHTWEAKGPNKNYSGNSELSKL
ncbi:uncharacterized protein EAF01_003012 [Botrytis porri]|uniref:Uncharacterized protein n=1 Tax=Botrytis porri TaxID=87229 RepID=A0A4Z1KMN2_9HELO|nr:uncharacterized protein EAF01_003012 [Botrytis porri]KAF7909294.1 hypothetical protein EAF01_003012 [Botrytis porri]TGO86740.1 hypothetical protein BPOR_0280g00090 [Botrytis porri]